MVRRVDLCRVCDHALLIALVMSASALAQPACSPSSDRDSRVAGAGAGNAGGALGAGGSSSGGIGALGGTTGINVDGSTGGGGTNAPCPTGVEWGCKIDACTGQPKTTVRAKVYDPSGQLPLYNVAVYVPNAEVDPIKDGPVCETCATPSSGKPVASALTKSNGEFVMEDVPVGVNVPLVIQIGKWRRQIQMSEVKACQENVFSDAQLFRLPKNQSEGHLPKIAMSSGEADSLECLLRRLGVSDSEFTNPDGPGRVNIFADKDSATSYQNGQVYPAASPNLWGTVENLRKYDIVLMSCQGSQSDGRLHTTPEKDALKAYVDGGGRVFLEHYHYSWLRGLNEDPVIESARKYPATPFPPVAVWALPTEEGKDADNGYPSYRDYQIDTSFPKGKDLADWLVNVGASTTAGTISLQDVKHPAIDVIPNVSQRWIFNTSANPAAVPYLTANTPIGTPVEKQCGRLVHTGIHVAKAGLDDTIAPFPSGCKSAALSAQEKAMAFLLFDLSSCVQNEKDPPKPPPLVF
jgi:hypothetical protein